MSFRRLLLNIAVLLAVMAMIAAGFWQLHRLSERREHNSTITSRSELPVVQIQDLAGIDDDYDIGDNIEFRSVRAVGVYQVEDQVLIRNRTFQGSAGFWVLTPLRLPTGEAVAVNRGWIPHGAGTGTSPADFASAGGEVEVIGLVRATVTAAGLQQSDPSGGVLTEMARPDLARLSQQLDTALLPVYLQLQAQAPPAGDWPVPVPPPDLGEGSHLAYAVQWFVFATIALVGYPLILRRLGRPGDRDREAEVV
ncbi:SURF1 family protein [Candidatus Poriferisocius sp.]|uniref:SURF1 family protein n=1 Tax=Candidatus Poriferisocius sp. TaxID=3101276 RepID=UPI003B59D751